MEQIISHLALDVLDKANIIQNSEAYAIVEIASKAKDVEVFGKNVLKNVASPMEGFILKV